MRCGEFEKFLPEHVFLDFVSVYNVLMRGSHADAHTQLLEREMLKCASHGKNFGTRYYAVEKRAQKLFGLSLTGYPDEKYPRHRYEKGEGFP